MNHSDFELNLKKVESSFTLGEGVSLEKIRESEIRLGINFPKEVIHFYKTINGLSVSSKKLELLPIEELHRNENFVIFGFFNGSIPVSFDISTINTAKQWNIVNYNSGYIITHTISSFLTNKIWAWLHRGREIWEKEIYT